MHDLIVIAFLVGFNFLIYFRTIFFSIIVDDVRRYQQIKNSCFKIPLTLKNILPIVQARIYGGGTFAHEKTCWACDGSKSVCTMCNGTGRAWSIDTRIDHVFTLAIHIVNCILIYYVFGKTSPAIFAAFLYACNPVNNQTSIWLNGRRYAITITLTLLAALTSPLGILFYLATAPLQVTALFAPVIYGWWWLLAGAVLLFLVKDRVKAHYARRMQSIVNPDMTTWHWGRVTVAIKTFGFSVRKMVLPGKTMMCYPFLSDWGLTEEGNKKAYSIDFDFIVGVMSLFAGVYGLFVLPHQMKLYVAFFLLATLQNCNIQTSQQTFADRYISLPNVLMMFFVSSLAFHFLGSYAITGLVALAVYYVTQLQTTMEMYKGMNAYYDYHNYHYPENTIVRKFKINWMLKTGDVLGGWDQVRIGLNHNPKDFSMLYQAAIATRLMEDHEISNQYLDQSEANHYIGQKDLWQKHLNELREANNAALSSKNRMPHITPQEFARAMR